MRQSLQEAIDLNEERKRDIMVDLYTKLREGLGDKYDWEENGASSYIHSYNRHFYLEVNKSPSKDDFCAFFKIGKADPYIISFASSFDPCTAVECAEKKTKREMGEIIEQIERDSQ